MKKKEKQNSNISKTLPTFGYVIKCPVNQIVINLQVYLPCYQTLNLINFCRVTQRKADKEYKHTNE